MQISDNRTGVLLLELTGICLGIYKGPGGARPCLQKKVTFANATVYTAKGRPIAAGNCRSRTQLTFQFKTPDKTGVLNWRARRGSNPRHPA